MMMGQCMKDALSKDLQNANKQFIFIRVGHFIEVKWSQIKLTDKDNYQLINFITREDGIMTYLTEKEDKYMVKTHIMMVILFKVEKKDGDFITGMLNNVTLDSLWIIWCKVMENSFCMIIPIKENSKMVPNKGWELLQILKIIGNMKGSFWIIKWTVLEDTFGMMGPFSKENFSMIREPMKVKLYLLMVILSIVLKINFNDFFYFSTNNQIIKKKFIRRSSFKSCCNKLKAKHFYSSK